MTEQRRVIARVLSDSADHPDVEEVTGAPPRSIPRSASPPSIARCVCSRRPTSSTRHDFGDGRARYEEMPTRPPRPSHRPAKRAGDRVPATRRSRSCSARSRRGSATGWSTTGSNCSPCRSTKPDRAQEMTRRREARERIATAVADPVATHRAPIDVCASGTLQVRLAETTAEIDAAQALRYRVFYRGDGRAADAEMARVQRDFDEFDDGLRPSAGDRPRARRRRAAVVGTYRLIRRAAAQRTAASIPPANTISRRSTRYPGEILELGRSCVDAAARSRADDAAAVARHRGLCLPPRDRADVRLRQPARHRSRRARRAALLSLSPSSGAAGAAPARAARALCRDAPARAATRSIRPRALAELPPLIKGYLRLGGFVGDGAVIDHQFNTTDVCVMVKTDLVTEKYYRHYERHARADAAPDAESAALPAAALARGSLYLALTLPLMPIQAVAAPARSPARAPLAALLSPPGAAASSASASSVIGEPSRGAADAVRRQPRLLSRHRDPGRVDRRLFVAKAEVAHWPLFGWLAKLQRTVFVDRRPGSAAQPARRDHAAARRGDNLILFPEGTSGDGIHVLPFKSALFASPRTRPRGKPLTVQPISVAYTRLDGMPLGRFYRPFFAWYGDMEIGAPSLDHAGARHADGGDRSSIRR